MGLIGRKHLRARRIMALVLIVIVAASYFHASQYGRIPDKYGFTVHGRPLLKYTQMGFQEGSMVRDLWNESFEVHLNTTNHYWYGGNTVATDDSVNRNNTLDPGFEEVSSSSLNPYVNLPSWFICQNTSDVTVKAVRSGSVSYSGSYSAYLETRYVNITASGFTWQTPAAINDSCSSGAENTIDDNTGTEWKHVTSELHWVIYDLGQDYMMRRVRVYCGNARIEDVDIYVSSNASDFGSPVVELWDPPNNNSWSESPIFYEEGRYIKLIFGTTDAQDKLTDAFYEFDAYVRTSGRGHVSAGLRVPQDYFVRIPYVYLSDNPDLSSALLLDDAGAGSGVCDAYYLWVEVEIQNETSALRIVYVVPVTVLGFPSLDHFTNTTSTKYIYGVTTIGDYDVWTSFTRNVTSDYESIWGQVYNATVSGVAIRNDFFNPATESETNTPLIKANYDAVSLELASQGDEEELVNGGFEAPGWVKVQENKLDAFNYTKDSSNSKEGTTSFFMNVTGDTSGTSGSGFSATKHGVVAINSSSFIRESNDTCVQRLRGFIKVENMSGVLYETECGYVAIRIKFQQLSEPYDTYQLFYCVMLYSSLPSSNSSQKYVELVKSSELQTGVWYEFSRRPMVDGGWENVKVTEVALVVAFYYGKRSSTSKANAVARFDYIRLIQEESTEVSIRESVRSTSYVLDGNYTLRQNASLGELEYDVYETGAENANNTFYVAFPDCTNFSIYYYVASYQGNASIQVSLAIDDGPNYGSSYLYELIYYYGSTSGVDSIFLSGPKEVIEVSPSITNQTWVNFVRNWTLDLPSTWTVAYPRVEAVGLKIWTSETLLDVYWDLAAFYGVWYGANKTVELQSINEIYARKFNFTDDWGFMSSLDPGIDDFVDNNVSDVDSSSDRGSHSNFTNEQLGPDLLYDTLTEEYIDEYLTDTEDFVDNNSSDVDNYPDRGTHGNFTAEQYGPDTINDTLTEEDMGSGTDIEDFVDNNSSDVDLSPDKGSHSNFTAEQSGPDDVCDNLTEGYAGVTSGDWGITSSSFTDTSTHTTYRYMGGTSPDADDMQVTKLNIRVNGPGTVAIALYTGGTLTDPTGATKRTEAYNVSVVSGWNEIDVPDYDWPKNTVTWIGWAHNTGIYYSNSSSDAGDFQSARGRWDQFSPSDADETQPMPTNPSFGWFADFWYAVYAEYETDNYELDLEVQWTNADYSEVNEELAIYVDNGNNTHSLDATGGYMVVGDGTPDWGSTTGTISFWIKWDSVGGRPWGQHTNMETRFSGSNLVIDWGADVSLTSSTSFTAGEWYFIAIVWDENTNDLYLYVGDQDNPPTEDAHNGAWTSTVSTLGVTQNNFMASRGGVGPTDGHGDELRYWDTDRSLTEIQSDYDTELTGSETNLRSYFKLNNNFDDVGPDDDDGSGSGSYSFSSDAPFDAPTEEIRVDVWTGSAWQNLFTNLANGWNNVSVTSYLTSSNFTIRFKGGSETFDPTQDSWQIDAALLHVWTPVHVYYYVDNNTSDVDSSPDKGSHGNFTAEQYGPDDIYDTLTEENTNPPPNDVEDYVDNNSSDVDSSPDKGSHGNFTAEQYGPDDIYDTLTEENTNPPPNDVEDYVDDNSGDVDSSPDLGSHGNFTAEQYGPDSIYDTLTEEYTGIYGVDMEDYVDDNSGDVDSSPDLGSHGNFTAEQYGPDSIYDTLAEENTGNGTGTWTNPVSVYDKCGEEGGSPATDTIDDDTESDWRHLVGELHWVVYDMNKSMIITKVRILAGTTPTQYTVEDVNVYVSEDTTFEESEKVVTDWDVPKGGWDVSPSFNKRGRYIKLDNMNSTQPGGQLKFAFYEFDAWTVVNYELDLEVRWTSVNYTQENEELCIYGGAMGSEDLQVDIWNGSAWINLRTDLYSGWNNVSVSSYLTNSNFTIRFLGGTETGDGIQETWKIDAVLLHVWTLPDPNYELDLEVRWTSVDYDEVSEELCIRTGDLGSEDIKVDYWTGSTWDSLFTDLTANSWNNVSVSLTGPTFTIRFKGETETDDETEDSWQIDAVLLHVWTEGPNYELDLEVQWTSVDYDEVSEELCIYAGSLGSENLRVAVRSGSTWVNVLTDLNSGWNNVSVTTYLDGPELTIRFKGGTEADDETLDSWQIDAVLLHVWTEGPNYELDLEVQWTNVNYTQENEELCIYASSLDSENILVECWTGAVWQTLLTDLTANSWNNVSVSTYLTNSNFTIRFRGGTELNDTVQGSWQIDAALLHVWTEGGYQLDLEVQFTSVDYDEVNEELCIYTGNLDSEDILVEGWFGGGWVTLFTDLTANSWNNISVSTYLTSSTFTIRFKGGYDVTEDTVQDSWQIDAVLLHVWTFLGYQLDLEVQFTAVNNYRRSGKLCVYTGTLGGENLRVDYWTGLTWSNLITGLGAKSWNNVSIPLTSIITIRFKGGTEVEDTVQNSWQIDAVLIHTWLTQSGSSARANATSANGWYYKWWDIRKIYVKNATDTYEITANSTSQGILSFYDNDWNPEDDAATYDDDSTGYVKYNVTDFKLTAYGKNLEYQDYVIVEYVILFSGPSGVFAFYNNSTATAACDADEYGQEFWLVDKQGSTYRNYITSNSTYTITY